MKVNTPHFQTKYIVILTIFFGAFSVQKRNACTKGYSSVLAQQPLNQNGQPHSALKNTQQEKWVP